MGGMTNLGITVLPADGDDIQISFDSPELAQYVITFQKNALSDATGGLLVEYTIRPLASIDHRLLIEDKVRELISVMIKTIVAEDNK